MKNIRLKLLMTILVMFSCTLFFNIEKTKAVYKETKTTTISLTVINPSSTVTITYDYNDGVRQPFDETKTINTAIGPLTTPTRTNHNFLGWFDGTSSNANRIYGDELATSNVTYYAHWKKIVCKKVTSAANLNTETCAGDDGCRTNGTGYSAQNNVITYGTIYGSNSPIAGDAFDCDIDDNDVYDETDQYDKHVARFYFVREKENQGSDDTAVLIYYTSYDSNGRVDSQHTNKDIIGSGHYDVALGWLPTSSTNGWSNSALIDFDPDNGKITRFLSVDDLVSVCGPLKNDGTQDTAYLTACFNRPSAENPNVTIPNWFMFENSRFQSKNLGRAGIWLEYNGVRYTRLQTSSLAIGTYSSASGGDNMARPVIEIPMTALEGYVPLAKYELSFETHGGSS